MNYLSLSDLRNFDRNNLETYVNQIIPPERNNTTDKIVYIKILEQLMDTPESNMPISDYCLNYLVAVFAENINRVDWKILPKEFKVVEEDLHILQWYMDDIGPVFAFLTEKSVMSLASILSVLEVDNEATLVNCPTVDHLKERTEDYNNNIKYLKFLGLVPLDEEEFTEVLPPIHDYIADNVSRFSSAIWFDTIKEKVITLAGIGGIGSYLAFLLSRMQPEKIIMYDDDIVEVGNMSGQLYSRDDVGVPKVSAMSSIMSRFSNYDSVVVIDSKYTEDCHPTNIMICGFDNMAARKTFFESWYNCVCNTTKEFKQNMLFIDGRLAAEEFQVFCMTGEDDYSIERYKERYLFSDSEADETVCSYKQTTFMANMIASVMVNLFTNFAANLVVSGIRDLPFLTTYSADSMTFKVEL